MTGSLRKQLKFEGVIITDALNMRAIAKNFDEIETVLMCIKAGRSI
ncbi:MAG: hypothetical protein LBD17_05825 [Endomicrobium sp.]|nr:hypothetical protein [Endomicrobium sp.]